MIEVVLRSRRFRRRGRPLPPAPPTDLQNFSGNRSSNLSRKVSKSITSGSLVKFFWGIAKVFAIVVGDDGGDVVGDAVGDDGAALVFEFSFAVGELDDAANSTKASKC